MGRAGSFGGNPQKQWQRTVYLQFLRRSPLRETWAGDLFLHRASMASRGGHRGHATLSHGDDLGGERPLGRRRRLAHAQELRVAFLYRLQQQQTIGPQHPAQFEVVLIGSRQALLAINFLAFASVQQAKAGIRGELDSQEVNRRRGAFGFGYERKKDRRSGFGWPRGSAMHEKSKQTQKYQTRGNR